MSKFRRKTKLAAWGLERYDLGQTTAIVEGKDWSKDAGEGGAAIRYANPRSFAALSLDSSTRGAESR